MAIVKMKKFFILTNKNLLSKITETLQNLGIVQIINIFTGADTLAVEPILTQHVQNGQELNLTITMDENILKLQYLLNFLPQLATDKKSFIEDMIGGKTVVSESDLKKEICFFDFKAIFEECKNLETELHSLANEKSNILKVIDTLLSWKNLPDSLENIYDTETSFNIFLRIPSAVYGTLHDILDKEFEENYVFYKIQEEKREIFCVLLSLKNYQENILKILKTNSIVPLQLPLKDPKGKVSDILENLNRDINKIDAHKQEIEQRKIALAGNRSKLTLLYDHFQSIKNRLTVQNDFGATLHTVIIKGWIKESDVKILEPKLMEMSDEIIITYTDPVPESESVPIALKNSRIIKPFELIVRLYGMPNYQEKDPTPLIAFFFSIIFAIALSDAVYGFALSATAYWILKKYKFAEEDTDILWLFIWCGLVTVVVGAFMGSWCGDLPKYLPAWVQKASNSMMLFDPLKDLKVFIGVSLAVGVLHVFAGLGFKAYQNIIGGKAKDAFFDQVSWMILVGSLICMGLAAGNMISPELKPYFSMGAKIGALIIILFGARDVKNIFGRVGGGLYKLYGVSSYISDILSYIRLLALGLATGIVGMVINIMAFLTTGAPMGFLIVGAILTGGHIFNVVINLLGAFVHTCRLHYVEFFGKFYDNGGKAFIPFRKEGKYYIVK
ncbi:V-type ATP synthase subunit I [Candidatus Poribacteria bacterium]|nr:V-type ATP synthase subunit I [Candidatus Poribacteria bacterium]